MKRAASLIARLQPVRKLQLTRAAKKNMKHTRTRLLNDLGERIAAHRAKAGLSLEDLSSRMGISKGNLCDIENGKRDPRYLTLKAIAEGLSVPLTQLLNKL